MKFAAFLIPVAMTSLAATARPAASEDTTLSFGCTDVVVVGRLKNGDWEHVEIPDDVLGHGWASATIKVRRILKGTRVPIAIPVRYFGHTYLREDRDFMFVLRKDEAGAYTVRTAQLMQAHPRLAVRCEP